MHRVELPGFKPVLSYIMHLAICAAAAVTVSNGAAQEESEESSMFWSTTLKMVRAKFPEVAQVSTDTLASWLDESGGADRPLIVDTREQGEYEVSHLEGALKASSEDEALKALEGATPGRRVVLYCSVGYRSSEMARFLMKKGYGEIYNLEGSIFAWANEGRPVYRGDQQVDAVHPYDRVWGKLLKKSLRAK